MWKKEAHKGQVEEKFALIELILPQIAQKSGKKINKLSRDDFEELMKTIKETEFMEPKKDCLSPIGSEGLFKSAINSFREYHPAYFSQPVIKGPCVFSGHP